MTRFLDGSVLRAVEQAWHMLLQGWAADGSLIAAAREALVLSEEPPALAALVSQWTAQDFSGLPPIVLLSSAEMAGARGAYAIATGSIYLNADWAAGVSPAAICTVLTEELGHHLDALLNSRDTPGDEGELFASWLSAGGSLRASLRQRLGAEDDRGSVWVAGQAMAAEQALVMQSSPVGWRTLARTGHEYQNQGAMAALRSNGSVITWGDASSGGDSSAVAGALSSGVTQIFSSGGAFAALKNDGSVITWGASACGGDSSALAGQLDSGVTQIFSSYNGFAALKSDGTVVTWGGISPMISGNVSLNSLSNIQSIFSTGTAFAAIRNDGSVVTWGSATNGGDSSAVADRLTSDVTSLSASGYSFAALKSDGSVISWGNPQYGGDSSAVASSLTSDIKQIYSVSGSYNGAFAAVKNDGSVVTWGSPYYGGNSSSVADKLRSNVTKIYSSDYSFAALKSDGSVVTWGAWGGDSSSVASRLTSGVRNIWSGWGVFAALKSDGSVVTWGFDQYGGDSSAVSTQLASNVTDICPGWGAFAALKGDGSVITWGYGPYGGDSSIVASQLTSGVSQIFSNGYAFSALKTDGSVVTWGDSSRGGDSSLVSNQLTNVVSFANFYTDDKLVFTNASPTGSITISGTPTQGETLTASNTLADLDGIPNSGPGAISYQWHANGSPIAGATANTYTLTQAEVGKTITVTASYTDNDGTAEAISSEATAIVADDTSLIIMATDATKPEGHSGNTSYTFTVRRNGDTSGSSTAQWAVSSTQTTGDDFTGGVLPSGSVVFAAGQTEQTITVEVNGDTVVESDEAFTVTLSAPSGAMLDAAASSATGIIRNDDPPTVISLTASSRPVAEDGPDHLFYTFTRSGASTHSLVVHFKVGGTASFGSDYTQAGATSFSSSSGSITFAAGASTAILSIDPARDSSSEGNETIEITLSTGAGYGVGTATGVVGTLVDNDVNPGMVASAPLAISNPGRSGSEFRNIYAFAALKADGSVITWGNSSYGGDSSSVASKLTTGVTQIFSTHYAFAALKTDGSVVTWGDSRGGGDSSAQAASLASGVTQIFSTTRAFAALKADGSVITWGYPDSGGDAGAQAASLASGVSQIFSAGNAFAALKSDGSVITWGDSRYGGDSSAQAASLTSGVSQIFSTANAFAALKADGSVVTWGYAEHGGDSSTQAASLASGVTRIFSTKEAFAALKADGSLVTWGYAYSGGNAGAKSASLAAGVTQVFSTGLAFAALKNDGSVITWGQAEYGGESSAQAASLAAGVTQIFSSHGAFAALKSDGSVITWGAHGLGGDSSAQAASLAAGVTQIFSSYGAFAALKTDGSIVTWGESVYGGDSSAVADKLSSGVVALANPFSDDRLIPQPVISLAVSPASVTEDGAANLIYTFTRNGINTNSLVVNFKVGGTASFGSDYTQAGATSFSSSSGSVTFAAESATATVTLDPMEDPTMETDETVALTLGSGAGYSIGTTAAVTGIIRNDDNSLAIAAASADQSEGNSGTTPYTFIVTRTGNTSGASSATWSVAAAPGSSVTAADFSGGSFPTGTVTFAAGETSKTITVKVNGDTVVESDEAFSVTLSAASGATLDPAASSATGIIRNDDFRMLAITAAAANKPEGNSGITPYTFTVTRTGNTSGASSATWTVAAAPGSSVSAADFSGGSFPSGTVTFAAGEISKTITVDVIGDTVVESHEAFTVTLAAASGATITTAAATGTIRNDDTSLAIAAAAANKAEGNSGITPYTFTVTRTGNTSGASSATWTVAAAPGSSVSAADFSGGSFPSGTVTFAAGNTSKTITVNVIGDTVVESDEAFTVTLAAASGATITTAAATGTIRNDDLPSITLTLLPSPAVVSEDGAGHLLYTFARTGPVSGELSINCMVSGSATFGTDYSQSGAASFSSTEALVRFAAGSATATVSIDPVADTDVETSETVSLTLKSSTSYRIGTSTAVTGTIRNDDVSASSTTTLSDRMASLTLTGNRRINGIGNGLDNVITGNNASNKLYGKAGKDVLTGGGAGDNDVFGYDSLTESLLIDPITLAGERYDIITDFNSGDRLSVPLTVNVESLSISTGSVASPTAINVSGLLSTTLFAANSVAAFTANNTVGTFVAINDNRDGFQPESDAIILLKDYAVNTLNTIDFI